MSSTRAQRSRIAAAAQLACAALAVLAIAACGDDDGAGVTTGDRDAAMSSDAGRDAGPDSGVTPPSRPQRPDAGSDAGAPDSGPDPDDDGGLPSCGANGCSHLTDGCNVGVCDPSTVTCRAEPRADDTPCGSSTLDFCTAPDTCQAGICVDNDRAEGTPCGPQDVDCHRNDECDGDGQCVDHGLRPVGTACGSQADDDCSAPDTCDALGDCQPNHAPEDTLCADLGQPIGTLCRHDDRCDGEGECVDQGNWTMNACPPGVDATASGHCICGNAVTDICHPTEDVCIEGECVVTIAPDDTPCGTPDMSDCDLPDSCQDGLCAVNFVGPGIACGDQAPATTCNQPDTCDGSGQCSPNHASANTECGASPGECFQNPRCDGDGLCATALPAIPGSMCGDQTDTVCDEADSCDGAGGCEENLAPVDTSCGAAPAGACDLADSCDGTGTCLAVFADEGTICGDEGVACVAADTCDAIGTCVDNGFLDEGEPCGSGDETDCDLADSCNGTGLCSPNYVAQGTDCGDPPDACFASDSCDGAGACDAGDPELGCAVPLAGTVVDFGDDPLAAVTVEVIGSDPLETAVSDSAGGFTLSVPLGVDVLLRAHPTASYFGLVTAVHVLPGDSSLEPLALIDDATASAMLAAPGLAALDTELGILAISLAGASGAGGESATIAPSCAQATCGPLVLDSARQPVLSNTLQPDGANDVIFTNVPTSDHAVTVAGVSGTSECEVVHDIAAWPVFEHTVTSVIAQCAP